MYDYKLQPGKTVKGFVRGAERIGTLRNSTGSNTHVPPHDLVHYSKELVPGYTDTWSEYIPTTYDGSKAVPLVICNHAGGSNSEVQFDETGWAIVAETEGLIVAYPNAIVPGMWLGDPDAPPPSREPGAPRMKNPIMDLADTPTGIVSEDFHDIRFLCALIEEMKAKYNIDAGRVYMQGMSMGDLMTAQFSRVCGHLLAGAANAAGPSPEQVLFNEDGSLKAYDCPVPIYQSRGELDNTAINAGYSGTLNRWGVNSRNRDFWKKVNGFTGVPELAIRDYNNFAFYKGEKADLFYRDSKYRAHGQTLDDSVIAWRQLFSGTRRLPDGTIERTATIENDYADKGAAALAAGCKKVLIDNKLVELSAPVTSFWAEHRGMNLATREPEIIKMRELIYVPLEFLTVYYGIQVKEEGGRAELTLPNGSVAQVAENSIGFVVDNNFRSMSRQTEMVDGKLYVPVQWIASNIFGQFFTQCETSLYLSDHYGDMTLDMAQIIRETLE